MSRATHPGACPQDLSGGRPHEVRACPRVQVARVEPIDTRFADRPLPIVALMERQGVTLAVASDDL